MKVEYHYPNNLPRKLVWKWMKNEEVLKKTITGCKSFVETSTGVFFGIFDIQFGPIQDVFILDVWREKEKKPSFCRFNVKGKCKLGEIEGKIEIYLSESENGSDLTFVAELRLNGSLALFEEQFSKRTQDPSIKNFFKRYEKEIKKAILRSRRKGR